MIELSDEAGQSQAGYSYDAYGNQIKRTSGEDNAYRFSTKEYSSLTGLIYFGARYYDPEIGRFLTKDPLGFAGGINQYIYCESDPVNWIDPWGLCKGGEDKTWWKWWSYESVIPGPYGQPMSEWGSQGHTSWGDPMKYTEQTGGAWMWAERAAVGISAGAVITAGGIITINIVQYMPLHARVAILARLMELKARQLPPPSSEEIWRAIRTATRPVVEMVIK